MRGLIRVLVATAALAALVVGALRVAGLVWDVVNEVAGKCDYLPCVWPWTYPSLAAFGVLTIAGAVILGWMLFGRGGFRRERE